MSGAGEYVFEVGLITTLRVNADSEEEARVLLQGLFTQCEANFGCWPETKDPVVAEVALSTAGDSPALSLIEIDGNACPSEEERQRKCQHRSNGRGCCADCGAFL